MSFIETSALGTSNVESTFWSILTDAPIFLLLFNSTSVSLARFVTRYPHRRIKQDVGIIGRSRQPHPTDTLNVSSGVDSYASQGMLSNHSPLPGR
jgi:hypothetical protein